jgi:hypothetical protein
MASWAGVPQVFSTGSIPVRLSRDLVYSHATRVDFVRYLSYPMALAGTVALAIAGLHFFRQGSVRDG